MAKSRKNAVKKTKNRRRRNLHRSYKLRGAGWWDDLTKSASSAVSSLSSDPKFQNMGNQANNFASGISNSPTFQGAQQGFNNMGNKVMGMMSGLSNSPTFQGAQQGFNNMTNKASNLYNTHIGDPNSDLNQGLNNYGQKAKGVMRSLFSSSNNQQPQTNIQGSSSPWVGYNQGSSSPWVGYNQGPSSPLVGSNKGSSSWFGGGKRTRRKY